MIFKLKSTWRESDSNRFGGKYGGGCRRGFDESWAAVLAKGGGCVAYG